MSTDQATDAKDKLRADALHYHRHPKPGKLEVTATKPLANQRDLALAYSPGVAAACDAIVADPAEAATMTSRGNLVAVVSNGTAVLGLGAIGALASKPVMEGKAVLFKKFAGIDVFDIEVDENDPHKLVDVVTAISPTFGAINLEDIKAPDCFIVEKELRERLDIPVFHDDQHGTAIVVAAAVINGLSLVNKKIDQIKLVLSGGGAAGIACLNQLLALGLNRDNVILCDRKGVVYRGRAEGMTEQKAALASDTKARTLQEAFEGADVFLGVSAPGVVSGEMVKTMAKKPIIMALANPEPEIRPEVAKGAVADAIIATGRSDYPNQVNNVLCFPFIFRAALDVGATEINEEMKIACVYAIADLAKRASSEVVAAAYGGQTLRFGADYIIPKPFDPRLISQICPAIAKAAMDSGVATRPIDDLVAYGNELDQFVFRTGLVMKPIFDKACEEPKRVVFAEGEDDRVLFAAKVLLDDGIATPILIGRPLVISQRAQKLGLEFVPGKDFEIVNPENDDRYRDYWETYHGIMARKGVSPDSAMTIVRTNSTVIASMMVEKGDADAMICGTYGEYKWHLKYVEEVLGLCSGVRETSALSLLVLDRGPIFMCDTYVSENPTADEIVDLTVRAAEKVSDFGLTPRVALIATSTFGSSQNTNALKMRAAMERLHNEYPDFALNEDLRRRVFPDSKLDGAANLLVMPCLDAANTAFHLARSLSGGLHVGPILIGVDKPGHITTPSVSSRGLVNLAAVAVIDAQVRARKRGG